MDFVGKLIERVSGQRLDAYFQEHIFDPLGLTTLGFYPTDANKKDKMALCMRLSDGSIGTFPDGFGPGRGQTVDKVSTEFFSGGAGLFGTQKEFLIVLRAILQADPSSPHHSDTPIISPRSFKELFTGSIQTKEGRKALAGLLGLEGSWDSSPDASEVDHSVGFPLNLVDSPRGRKKGSGSWYGFAHTHFWIDPSSGIAVSPT
jgi:methyl acetate hydrolase